MLTRRRLLATLGLTAAAAATACSSPPATAAAGHLVQMQIVDRASGELLREHRHRGIAHVAGQPGARYAVRLSNRTGARVLVVLSVDGVNAVSGQTAAASQTGYVLAPWQTADITGWRKSDAEAAAFYFTALPDSYAARTDRPQNVGVVGVAVFRERVPVPPPVPFEQAAPAASADRRTAQSAPDTASRAEGTTAGAAAAPASPAPAAPAAAAREGQRQRDAERLGTGHGEREYAPINRTAFERASSQPAEVVQIRYDSHANLVAAGVIEPRHWTPQPFPGYVPDPR
ncbi:MAG: hypothetical protein JNL30_17890 [Rubrivivax sp.]|nr:hypothetical protein [Rubrivivax sp.]